MKTRYSSVAEMVRSLSDDTEFADDVAKGIQARNIISQLMALRAVQGISQQDIAKEMRCTQSRVSKLESSNDNDLRLGDLHSYVDVLGLDLTMVLTKKCQPHVAERIKFHISGLQRLIAQLAEVADGVEAQELCQASVFLLDKVSELLLQTMKKQFQPARDCGGTIHFEVQEDDLRNGREFKRGSGSEGRKKATAI